MKINEKDEGENHFKNAEKASDNEDATSVSNYTPLPSFRSQCFKHLKESVMEPYLAMIMFAYSCRSVTTQNLIRDKACLNSLGLNESICYDLHNPNYTAYENEVQSMATNYHTASTVISMVPSIFATVLLGSWSDIYGRKIPIIIATIGCILELCGLTLNVIGFDAPLGFMLVPAIATGISGGLMVIMTSAISYLTDVTEAENRAVRFAFLEMAFIFAAPIGTAAGGIIYTRAGKKNGYLAVYLTSIGFEALALFYILVRLKEPQKRKITDLKEAIGSLFSLENVKKNIRTCTRPREGNVRKQMWFMFLSMCATILCMMGSMSFAFYFTQKMYGWDTYKYSMVNMVFSILTGVVILVAVLLMTKVFKLHDAVLALIGVVSMAAGTVLKGLSYVEWLYYLACIIGILGGITNIGVRSRLSKLVSKDEIGKVFSVLSLCECLTPIIGMTLFGTIYSNTLHFFPGLAYQVTAAFLIIPFCVFIWIYTTGDHAPYEEMPDTKLETETEMEMPEEA